jgi:adenylosuccinate lyase
MIERYSRPAMKKIWSDKGKFDNWVKVEIAACQAWAELGRIPQNALPRIKKARVNLKRMGEILKVTHHDMTAFLAVVGETVGDDARYVHLGLTSSDVMDTALALQLRDASGLLLKDMQELIGVLEEKALAHKDTIMIGRTHGVHAEPITFGL